MTVTRSAPRDTAPRCWCNRVTRLCFPCAQPWTPKPDRLSALGRTGNRAGQGSSAPSVNCFSSFPSQPHNSARAPDRLRAIWSPPLLSPRISWLSAALTPHPPQFVCPANAIWIGFQLKPKHLTDFQDHRSPLSVVDSNRDRGMYLHQRWQPPSTSGPNDRRSLLGPRPWKHRDSPTRHGDYASPCSRCRRVSQ